jgi:homoserine kinase
MNAGRKANTEKMTFFMKITSRKRHPTANGLGSPQSKSRVRSIEAFERVFKEAFRRNENAQWI